MTKTITSSEKSHLTRQISLGEHTWQTQRQLGTSSTTHWIMASSHHQSQEKKGTGRSNQINNVKENWLSILDWLKSLAPTPMQLEKKANTNAWMSSCNHNKSSLDICKQIAKDGCLFFLVTEYRSAPQAKKSRALPTMMSGSMIGVMGRSLPGFV